MLPFIDLHMHTNYTDGQNSLADMVFAANQKGLDTIAITEHVRANSDWVNRYVEDICKIRKNSYSNVILGFETKIIDMNGNLDIPKKALNFAEIIVCSLHRIPGIHPMEDELIISGSNPAITTDVYIRALKALCRNSYVDIIGHPFDLLYKHKVPLPDKESMHDLARYISMHGKAVEINTRYMVPPKEFIEICKMHDIKFSIGSDAHDSSRVGDVNWAYEIMNSAHLNEKDLMEFGNYGNTY